MGRRASSPARRPAAAPAKPKPVASNTPAKTVQTAPAKPAAAAAPAAPAPVPQAGGGPGLMGMIAANVAGAAAGHVIGRGIADTIFGGRGESGAPVEASSASETLNNNNNPCFANYQMLQKCLNDNSNDITSCQWAYDMFKECKLST
eukprot:TRINITY_DN410_c0_g1_i1.p1 TRINITY_DN410_c0_g1~~TRINITY_DN410_c0_g1_i1.p1  ORF type:complete len:147 (+),score=50.27 TRINITY_DN410_c0_g1_i1:123-563(+)